jgi:hypothetical protein
MGSTAGFISSTAGRQRVRVGKLAAIAGCLGGVLAQAALIAACYVTLTGEPSRLLAFAVILPIAALGLCLMTFGRRYSAQRRLEVRVPAPLPKLAGGVRQDTAPSQRSAA